MHLRSRQCRQPLSGGQVGKMDGYCIDFEMAPNLFMENSAIMSNSCPIFTHITNMLLEVVFVVVISVLFSVVQASFALPDAVSYMSLRCNGYMQP